MNVLYRFSMARKMVLTFGTACVLSALLGVVSLESLSRINRTTAVIDSNWLPSVAELSRMRILLGDARRQEFNAILCSDNACLQRFIGSRQSELDLLRAEQAKYQAIENSFGTDESRALDAEFDQRLADYMPRSEQVMQLVGQSRHDEAVLQMRNVSGPAFDKLVAVAEANIQLHQKGATTATEDAAQLYERVKAFCVVLILCIICACALIGKLLASSISVPLRMASEVLARVAEKDLTHSVELNTKDELGEMASSVNTTIQAINGVLLAVTESADSLAEATNKLDNNAESSSNNAQTLSRQVQQVAATSQEISATINEISQNAERASEASQSSRKGAERGGQVMEETAQTMNSIADSTRAVSERITVLGERTREIDKVITVIQEISEQTNLLALNAAIEAARAGEHGRGFAVVAGEVRRLAERTTTSAGEIGRMIQSIQQETGDVVKVVEGGRGAVEHGIERMDEARTAIDAVVQLAQNTEQMVTAIATAAQEQSAASNEVSQTIAAMSGIASESAQASDQTANACKQLAELAGNLDRLVGQFQLRHAR
jgi:methyl-accepting chemotaxis protein